MRSATHSILDVAARPPGATDADSRKGIRSRDEWDKCVERGGPSLTVIRGKTHYAASLMSAADQQIPDDTRVVLEELITETGR